MKGLDDLDMDQIDTDDSKTLISVDRVLPPKLSLIPMKTRPIFPGIFMPLIIGGDKHIKTVEHVMGIDSYIGLVLVKNPDIEEDVEDNFYRIGTIAKILKKINLPDGKVNIFINTIRRLQIKKFLTMDPFVVAAVEYVEERIKMDNELQALTRTLYTEIKEVSEDNPFFTEEIKLNMANLNGAEKVTDFVASILNIDREKQQQILESMPPLFVLVGIVARTLGALGLDVTDLAHHRIVHHQRHSAAGESALIARHSKEPFNRSTTWYSHNTSHSHPHTLPHSHSPTLSHPPPPPHPPPHHTAGGKSKPSSIPSRSETLATFRHSTNKRFALK